MSKHYTKLTPNIKTHNYLSGQNTREYSKELKNYHSFCHSWAMTRSILPFNAMCNKHITFSLMDSFLLAYSVIQIPAHAFYFDLLQMLQCLFVYFWRNSPPPQVGQGLLIHEVSRSHTTTYHSRKDSSGRVISPTQRPLPGNTQHSRQASMPPVGFEPTIAAGKRPHNYALDCAAAGFDKCAVNMHKYRLTHHFTNTVYRPEKRGKCDTIRSFT
jgi:hypothetical protein